MCYLMRIESSFSKPNNADSCSIYAASFDVTLNGVGISLMAGAAVGAGLGLLMSVNELTNSAKQSAGMRMVGVVSVAIACLTLGAYLVVPKGLREKWHE